MNGFRAEIISSAEEALKDYDEVYSLLEYPEVTADKAYYLSVLEKYNSLNLIKSNLDRLKSAVSEEAELYSLLSVTRAESERAAVFAEISANRIRTAELIKNIASALGRSVEEKSFVRIKLSGNCRALFEKFTSAVTADAERRGMRISGIKTETCLTEFVCFGDGALSRLLPLAGCHRISASKSEISVAAVQAEEVPQIKDCDIKIDVFHSHGAGGQNINKVETAVRATHIPTGTVAVCQDERSQLKNRNRAVETLKRRVDGLLTSAEKQRAEEEIKAQFSYNSTPIVFYAEDNTFADKRLSSLGRIPLTADAVSQYLDALSVK